MKMFKDFWYLFFAVSIEGKKTYFLNYMRAKKYYHAQGMVDRHYYGFHVIRGYEGFHEVIMPRNESWRA